MRPCGVQQSVLTPPCEAVDFGWLKEPEPPLLFLKQTVRPVFCLRKKGTKLRAARGPYLRPSPLIAHPKCCWPSGWVRALSTGDIVTLGRSANLQQASLQHSWETQPAHLYLCELLQLTSSYRLICWTIICIPQLESIYFCHHTTCSVTFVP